MKFLDTRWEGVPIIPMYFRYHRPKFEDNFSGAIDIVFKEVRTGKKYVETIDDPLYEVYIVKDEYKDKYTFMHDYIPKSHTYPLRVHYSKRNYEIAKELGIKKEDVKFSPHVYGYDIPLDVFYNTQFLLEYPYDGVKILSMGFLDIESDIIKILGKFPMIGEPPTTVVTYIDGFRKESYTVINKTTAITEEDMARDPKLKELQEGYLEQSKYFQDHLDEFVAECHERFDEEFPDMEYHIIICDTEMEMETTLFKIMHACDNDFIFIWNSPYDIGNLIERPKRLGYDPRRIICDPRFKYKVVYFEEDKNVNIGRRSHKCDISTMFTFVDQMVIYTGIRRGENKLPSSKLNDIAKLELGTTGKIDYSEYSDIKHFLYKNYWLYILYNIKDVLLLLGIDRATNDSDDMYDRMYTDALAANEIFISTKMEINALRSFMLSTDKLPEKLVIGSNRNKLYGESISIIDNMRISKKIEELKEDNVFTSEDEMDKTIYELVKKVAEEPDEEEESDEEEDGKDKTKKKKKYSGAMVLNPARMTHTGLFINGDPSRLIHRYVIDMDVTSEYPSSIQALNLSNETMVAKIFIDESSLKNIPIYNNFEMTGDELAGYKQDVNNFFSELYVQRQYLTIGEIFFGLPSIDSILDADVILKKGV